MAFALTFLLGCVALTPPRRTPIRPGTRVHLTATGAPLVVRWSDGDATARGDCMATRIAGDLRALVGDTIRFRWVAELDAATPPDSACTPRTAATATIVAAPEAYRLEEERVSVASSVLGTVGMSVAVGLTILLLVSAADGIIDAVGRWF